MMVRLKSRDPRPTSSSRSSTMSPNSWSVPLATRSASSRAYSLRRSRAQVRAAPKWACRTRWRAGEFPNSSKSGGDSSGEVWGCDFSNCSHHASHSVLSALCPPTSAVRCEWSAWRIFGAACDNAGWPAPSSPAASRTKSAIISGPDVSVVICQPEPPV